MRNGVFAVVLLLCATVASAADFILPKQRIIGIDVPVPLGELVILSVSPPEPDPQLVSTSYAWKVLDYVYDPKTKSYSFVEKRTIDKDGEIFFGAGTANKTLRVFMVATHLFKKDTEYKAKSGFYTADIVIGTGDTPVVDPVKPPPPNPVDPPKPTPSFPDGRFGLSKFVYGITAKHVPPINRIAGTAALKTSFDTMIEKVKKNEVATSKELLKATNELNTSSLLRLGATQDFDVWSSVLSEELFRLYKDMKIISLTDYKDAYAEISIALAHFANGGE